MNTVQSGLPLERHQCGAKTRAGTPCKRWPPPGATRCRLHGGATPRSKAAAARRVAQAEAAQHVALWGGRRDITPAEALLELVQSKAAEVAWWEAKVEALDDTDRAGMLDTEWTRGHSEKTGPTSMRTSQASASILLQLLHKAQDQLAAYAAAALRAGVDEAMVKIATLQGHTILDFGRRVALAAGIADDKVEQILLSVIDQIADPKALTP